MRATPTSRPIASIATASRTNEEFCAATPEQNCPLRIRCMITRAWLLAGARDIGIPLKIVRHWSRRRSGWSGRACAGRLQGCGPPQEIVDQCRGGLLQFGQSSVDIAALGVSPTGGDRDGDRGANRGELKLDRRFAELLDAACSHGGAIAHETYRLAIPLGIDPVDRVLEHRGGSVIILGGDKDEAVGLRDRGGPSLYDLILVRRATRHGRRRWLIEDRHREVAKIEKPSVDTCPLLQMLQNPLRGLFRKTALPSTSDDYRNDCHALTPCILQKEKC